MTPSARASLAPGCFHRFRTAGERDQLDQRGRGSRPAQPQLLLPGTSNGCGGAADTQLLVVAFLRARPLLTSCHSTFWLMAAA